MRNLTDIVQKLSQYFEYREKQRDLVDVHLTALDNAKDRARIR